MTYCFPFQYSHIYNVIYNIIYTQRHTHIPFYGVLWYTVCTYSLYMKVYFRSFYFLSRSSSEWNFLRTRLLIQDPSVFKHQLYYWRRALHEPYKNARYNTTRDPALSGFHSDAGRSRLEMYERFTLRLEFSPDYDMHICWTWSPSGGDITRLYRLSLISRTRSTPWCILPGWKLWGNRWNSRYATTEWISRGPSTCWRWSSFRHFTISLQRFAVLPCWEVRQYHWCLKNEGLKKKNCT